MPKFGLMRCGGILQTVNKQTKKTMKKAIDFTGNELEAQVLKPMSLLKQHSMKDWQSEAMMAVTLANMRGGVDELEEEVKKMSWAYSALIKRQSLLSISIDKAVSIFIVMMTQGNIGLSILYSYYLQYWAKKNGYSMVIWNLFTMTIFPNGYPEEEELIKIMRKAKVDNMQLMDHSGACESIM